MKKRINLFSVFNNPMEDGIFTALQEYDVPWKNNNMATELNIDYLYNISGSKTISPIVDTLISKMYHKLDNDAISLLARIIYKRFSHKWERIYATYTLEYNPISNYDMTEQMINDTTQHEHSNTDNIITTQEKETSYGKTDTTTNNLQSQTQYGKTDTTTNNLETSVNTENETTRDISGFNSSDYSNADKETQTGESVTQNTGTQGIVSSGTDTQRDTGTQATASSGTDTENTGSTNEHENSGTSTDTRNYKLTRTGNIGVITSQQMIQSERDLWMWEFFKEVIYPDIDRVLTISYYGGY